MFIITVVADCPGCFSGMKLDVTVLVVEDAAHFPSLFGIISRTHL